jgi:serine/threonine-protein kinase
MIDNEAAAGPPGPEVGSIVASRYELVRRLGRGGMGDVWLARHLELRTEVAVKLWRDPGRDPGVDDAHGKLRALERFRLEAQISAQLALRSRHVVRAHDVGMDPLGPYLVMDYVRGPSLAEEIQAVQLIAADRVAAILGHVADALAVAHDLGIVHRDLKPDNLLLGSAADGSLEVKVCDFGVAKAAGSPLPLQDVKATAEGVVVGTLDYMSPEQLFGVPIDPRADCWALGVIAYEMLTGKNPFAGGPATAVMQRILTTAPTMPATVVPGIPRQLDSWFVRALETQRERRFSSVREMAVTFLAALPPPCETVVMKRPAPPSVPREANGVSVPAAFASSVAPARAAAAAARSRMLRRRLALATLGAALAAGLAIAASTSSPAWLRTDRPQPNEDPSGRL